MAKRTCRFGKVKRGKRKGQCLKSKRARKTRKGKGGKSCRFGVVRRGRRKGQCLKSKRSRKRR